MKLKQKLSLLSAMLLPILALAAYLLLVPALANATSCPGGMFKSSCGPGGTGCNTGTGQCVPNNGGGTFIYCPNGHGGFPGPGTCHNGVTCCTA